MTVGPVCKIWTWTAKRKRKKTLTFFCGAMQRLKGSTVKSHRLKPSGVSRRGKPQLAHPSLHHPPPLQKQVGKLMLHCSSDRLQDLLSISLCSCSQRAAQASGELSRFGAQLSQKGRTQACANLACAKQVPPLPTGTLAQGARPQFSDVPSSKRLAEAGRERQVPWQPKTTLGCILGRGPGMRCPAVPDGRDAATCCAAEVSPFSLKEKG